MTLSKTLLLGVCLISFIPGFSYRALASENENKYDNIKTEVNVSYRDSVKFRNEVGRLWWDLSKASFYLDHGDGFRAKKKVEGAIVMNDQIGRLSEQHAMKVRVRGARLRFRSNEENFEYFFPVDENGRLQIDRDMLLSLEGDNILTDRNIDIGMFELMVNTEAMRHSLESVKHSLLDKNNQEARIKLDALEQDLFITQVTQDNTTPKQAFLDWTDLALSVIDNDHFETLHLILQKMRADIVRMEKNETAFSPKMDIHHIRQRLDNLVLKSAKELRHQKVQLFIELKQWRTELQLEIQ